MPKSELTPRRRTGFQPVGAGFQPDPVFIRGLEALGDRLEACPTRVGRSPLRSSGRSRNGRSGGGQASSVSSPNGAAQPSPGQATKESIGQRSQALKGRDNSPRQFPSRAGLRCRALSALRRSCLPPGLRSFVAGSGLGCAAPLGLDICQASRLSERASRSIPFFVIGLEALGDRLEACPTPLRPFRLRRSGRVRAENSAGSQRASRTRMV